jgi:hypothetical protein
MAGREEREGWRVGLGKMAGMGAGRAKREEMP